MGQSWRIEEACLNDGLRYWLDLVFGGGTPKHALIGALVVGSILVAINHGDLILDGYTPSPLKIVLTYIVPYCVMTLGAVTQKRAAAKAMKNVADEKPRV